MKSKIVPQNKKHLKQIIKDEIELNGNECDLNHIDISRLKDISSVFYKSKFNGNISNWDTSNIKNMHGLFKGSKFNGDISKWNTSKVELMFGMFDNSEFNGDISKWNVSNVINMLFMFYESKFEGDLSNWKPYSLKESNNIFHNSKCPKPYWSYTENRNKAIDAYHLHKQLGQELNQKNTETKRIKL